MAIRVDIKRCDFFAELNEIESLKYFDCIRDKFVHNIDTLYYSVFLKDDNNENESLDSLFYELDNLKQLLRDTKGSSPEYAGLNVKLGSYGMVYGHRLSDPDKFDIFIADYLPNPSTPRIVIQLRSFGLWTTGVKDLILESYSKLLDVLKDFDVSVERTTENRIDYAYHTNSIQNPYKFFSDRNLDKYLHTSLSKYYKIGDIKKEGFSLDYIALGQLKSNNVFNRNYNKTKEVIELGYKKFFIDRWYEEGLISFYDKFCYEFAYKNGNYNSLDTARLEFYLKYGKDYNIKNEINLTLKDIDIRYDDIKKLADLFMPSVTIIMNIEFQTKRKFYYYADKQIELLSVLDRSIDSSLHRLFKILDNRKMFLDYITSETVAYISKIESKTVRKNGKKSIEKIITYQAWWKRLRSLKIKDTVDSNDKYKRIYSSELDEEKKIKQTINNIGSLSLYKGKRGTSFRDDVADLLCNLNDNDVEKMDLCFVNRGTGEIIDPEAHLKKYLNDYQHYKEKKYKAIKNRIPCDSPKS